MNPDKTGNSKCKNLSSGGMIRMLGVQQRNEVKSTQNLAIIVLFFMICWIPLYTINCIIAFYEDFHVNSTFMLSCIILSHLNSAGNPLLYAYHLKDFRAALKNFFCNLLGIQQECSEPYPARYASANYSHFKLQLRNSSRAALEYPKKVTCPKVSVIVHNSAVLATAATGKLDKNIWNIAEDSGRDSGSSQDSLKDMDSKHLDTVLMLRPATPFRSNLLKEVHEAYEDSQGAYINACLSYYKNIEETCLSDTRKSRSAGHSLNSHSKSSPQLARELFLVENNMSKTQIADNRKPNYLRSGQSPKRSHKLSPYKIVSSLFRNKKELNRSLSESDSLKKLNGVAVDYYSEPP